MRWNRLIASLLIITVSCPAAEKPPELPPGIMATISTPRFAAAMDGADKFAANLLRDTRQPYQEGMLVAAWERNFTEPFWQAMDPEGGIHVLYAEGYTQNKSYAVVLSTQGNDAFIAKMREDGVMSTADAEADPPQLASSAAGEAVLLLPFDERTLAFASNRHMYDLLHAARNQGWRPGHWPEADAVCDFRLPPEWWRDFPDERGLEGAVAEMIASLRQGGQSPAGDGANPGRRLIDGLFDNAESLAWGLYREVLGVERLILGVTVDADNLAVELRVFAQPDTYLGKAALANPDVADPGVARNADADADMFFLNAPLETMLPGFGQKVADALTETVGGAFPERRESMAVILNDILAFSTDERATVQYYRDGEDSYATWVASADAERGLRAYSDLIAEIRGIAGDLYGDPEKLFRFAVEDGEVDGTPCKLFSFSTKAFEWIAEGMRERGLDSEPAMIFTITAAKDDCLATVYGNVGGDDLGRALNNAAGAENPFWTDEPARRALAGVRHRQYVTGLFGIDYLYRRIMERIFIQSVGSMARLIMPKIENRVFNAVLPYLRRSDDLPVLTVGSDGQSLVARFAVTAEAANALAYNLTFSDPRMQQAMQEEMQRAMGVNPAEENE